MKSVACERVASVGFGVLRVFGPSCMAMASFAGVPVDSREIESNQKPLDKRPFFVYPYGFPSGRRWMLHGRVGVGSAVQVQ